MAKKMNSLAGDIEGISIAADNRVLAMLSEDTHGKARKGSLEEGSSPVRKRNVATACANGTKQPKSMKPNKSKAVTPPKRNDWGKPIAHFNTRIPERMSELLDDLTYRLRKQGTPRTKQELAHEALSDLLKKHSMF